MAVNDNPEHWSPIVLRLQALSKASIEERFAPPPAPATGENPEHWSRVVLALQARTRDREDRIAAREQHIQKLEWLEARARRLALSGYDVDISPALRDRFTAYADACHREYLAYLAQQARDPYCVEP